jgi:hypothetical protein
MFQTRIFRETFNKILMQCSYSKHSKYCYNYNKTKFVSIECKYHIYQNFKKCSKNGKHELYAIVYAKKKPK